MTDRCEPPEASRGMDGWHWVATPDGKEFCHLWWEARGRWGDGRVGFWRYISPVHTPAEVAALKSERDAAVALKLTLAAEMSLLRSTKNAEVAALRAENERLRGALNDARLQLEYMESRWPTGTTPTILVRIDAALKGDTPCG